MRVRSTWAGGLVVLVAVWASGCSERSEWDASPIVASAPKATGTPTGESSYGGGLAGGAISGAQWQSTVKAAESATLEVFNTGCEYDATGSGVLVAPDVVVTNRHVVEGARTLEVAAGQGTRIPVQSWDVSTSDDLAVLRLPASAGMSGPLALSEHAAVPGDLVAALGYPLGGPLTSGLGRVVEIEEGNSPMIRASMDVLPGNSGGPLIGSSGQVVGLIRAIDLVEGWTLAIPVARVARAVDGQDLRLGVSCSG